uniref:Uncharacterized protein n=1 Tax=uncultured myxobacterium HF0070_11L13 TaxID=723554 RepID=E7C1Z4_9BACT|nr:hypothetical protein [uncultured myxobacterium HF0070_11L13]
MKNFFSVIIIFVILLVMGGYVYVQKQDVAQREEISKNLSKVRRNFASRARDAINQEDGAEYLRNIKAALKSYDEELDRTVYAKNPEARDIESYTKLVEEEFEKGSVDEGQRKRMLERHKIVRKAYDILKGQDWRPVLTAKGKGDTRLDIYNLQRTTDPNGAPLLQGDFFFWGLEDSTDVSWGDIITRIWKVEKEMVKEGRKKVEKDVEKVLGRVEGSSEPYIIITSPHKNIDFFPSFVSIGTIRLAVLPAESVKIDMELTYSTRRGGGGEVESVLKWEKLDVPPGWRLSDGQEWDADEVEATEEEIAGKDPNETEDG